MVTRWFIELKNQSSYYCSDTDRQRHEVRYSPLYKFHYAFPCCRKLCFLYLCIYLLSLDKQRACQFVDSQWEDYVLQPFPISAS